MKKFDISKFRVLIVDDNTFMRRILNQIFRSLNVSQLMDASDGIEALTKLQSFNADLIVVDWEMEPMNGLDFIKRVRAGDDVANRFVPIIMATEFSEYYRITEARDAGVNELIIKPVSVNLLYTRIMSIVERPRSFIESPGYFGPDRRRHQSKFAGTERRQEDPDIEYETLEDTDDIE